MCATILWLLVAILSIGSCFLKNDINEYEYEIPIPVEGISAQDIFHQNEAEPEQTNDVDGISAQDTYNHNGGVPEKIKDVCEPSFERRTEEAHDYDDCDSYFGDESTANTCSALGECEPQRQHFKQASPKEDPYGNPYEYDLDEEATIASPSP
ncbi:uncharacterized protein LOC119160184 isoform X2 [Rhipicephalus microplus]|uniref:uncharacterized protein LOC119160184 isoform X2 n=1 Tax=Rhipicephalus microplus TaxID=6941 RepID=UPI003F6CF1EF